MTLYCFDVYHIEWVHHQYGTSGMKLLIDRIFHTDKNPVAVKRQAVARGEYPPNVWVKRSPRYSPMGRPLF